MSVDTHISEINGYSRGALINMVKPYPDQIRFSLNQFDGPQRGLTGCGVLLKDRTC